MYCSSWVFHEGRGIGLRRRGADPKGRVRGDPRGPKTVWDGTQGTTPYRKRGIEKGREFRFKSTVEEVLQKDLRGERRISGTFETGVTRTQTTRDQTRYSLPPPVQST